MITLVHTNGCYNSLLMAMTSENGTWLREARPPGSEAFAIGRGSLLEQAETRPRKEALDECLRELEEANERGETRLSATLAERIRAHIPAAQTGLDITEALELVFSAHERRVARRNETAVSPPDSEDRVYATHLKPLGRGEARHLTDRIKAALGHTCLLLEEAHKRHAWAGLGYASWAQYARQEFHLSRSRSYELLDQARVIQAVRTAGEMSGVPDISATRAARIKPVLDDVVTEIRSRTSSDTVLTEDERERIVREVVADRGLNWLARRQRQQPPTVGTDLVLRSVAERGKVTAGTEVDVDRLSQAISYLANMPAVADVIAQAGSDVRLTVCDLEMATEWLTQFTLVWSAVDARFVSSRVQHTATG